jgi:hypothetical protein
MSTVAELRRATAFLLGGDTGGTEREHSAGTTLRGCDYIARKERFLIRDPTGAAARPAKFKGRLRKNCFIKSLAFRSRLLTLYMRDPNEQLGRRAGTSFE